MHGRGIQPSAPVSDAAGRGDAGGTPQTARPCRVVPRGESRIGSTRADAAKIDADAAEIGADAAQIGPTRSVSAVSAESGRNSKKKEKGRSDRLTWCRDFFIKNVWCRLSFGKGKPWGN